MKSHQFNVRIDNATRDKLETLKVRYGSYSKAFAVAIDRIHREESTVASLDWTKRVNELQQMAGDYYSDASVMIGEYDVPEDYIDALCQWIYDTNQLDEDERTVIRNRIDALVNQ